MNEVIIAALLGALGTAGGVIWAVVESRRRVKAEAARDRWKNAFDLASEHVASAANELHHERERAAEAELRARAAANVTLADLETCRSEIPKLIAAADPADAPRLAGDFLERSLQRAVEATRRATAPARRAGLPPRGPAPVPGVDPPREGG